VHARSSKIAVSDEFVRKRDNPRDPPFAFSAPQRGLPLSLWKKSWHKKGKKKVRKQAQRGPFGARTPPHSPSQVHLPFSALHFVRERLWIAGTCHAPPLHGISRVGPSALHANVSVHTSARARASGAARPVFFSLLFFFSLPPPQRQVSPSVAGGSRFF